MRPARPDNLWQWRNIWGSILFVLQIVDMKYHLNLARSTKKFTEMFQKLRPKLQLLVGREKNVCSNCLDFHSSLQRFSSNSWLFFQQLGRMFQLLGVEVTKAQLSFDTTVISRVQKVGSIVPLESRIYAVWSLNIEGGNILYNSVFSQCPEQTQHLE